MSALTPLIVTPMGSGQVDFSGSWQKFWGGLASATGFQSLSTLLGIIGLLVVVFAVVMYFFQKARGGMGGMGGGGGRANGSGIMWAVVAGMMLSAPNFVIPFVLGIIDILANVIIGVAQKVT